MSTNRVRKTKRRLDQELKKHVSKTIRTNNPDKKQPSMKPLAYARQVMLQLKPHIGHLVELHCYSGNIYHGKLHALRYEQMAVILENEGKLMPVNAPLIERFKHEIVSEGAGDSEGSGEKGAPSEPENHSVDGPRADNASEESGP